MISESFDRRTLANMEIALERACEKLATGSEKYTARRHIAGRIVKCAESGNRSLGSLTAAALAAAKQLESKRRLQRSQRSPRSRNKHPAPQDANPRSKPAEISP